MSCVRVSIAECTERAECRVDEVDGEVYDGNRIVFAELRWMRQRTHQTVWHQDEVALREYTRYSRTSSCQEHT